MDTVGVGGGIKYLICAKISNVISIERELGRGLGAARGCAKGPVHQDPKGKARMSNYDLTPAD